MKIKPLFILFLFSFLLGLNPIKSLADWAYSFVVWDGYTYVVSDEVVNQIDQEIGQMTMYSDIEGTYSGNFSNTFKKGTKYYSLKNVDTNETIAIGTQDGNFVKAMREGPYADPKSDDEKMTHSNRFDYANLFIGLLALFQILAFSSYFVTKRFK
ncbi:MAG: hypothetical protein ACE3JQ_13215 [Paenisporosarcina sp.]